MIKGIVSGTEKDIVRIPMIVNGAEKNGWEVRKGDGTLIWGRNDTISVNSGTMPIKGYGVPLVSLTPEGNSEQSGTPTPTNPIDVTGTGERTGNLAPPNSQLVSGYITTGGGFGPATEYAQLRSDYTKIPNNVTSFALSHETGTFPSGATSAWRVIAFYDSTKTFIERQGGTDSTALIASVPQNAVYYAFSFRTFNKAGNVMLNSGQTAQPYEPYGWKVPLTANFTTTPIYLGQTPSVRRVKKLVLTGNETISKASNNPVFVISISTPLSDSGVSTVSTHYQAQSNVSGTGNVGDMSVCIRRGYSTLYIGDTRYNTAEDFKQFLRDEYAAGTPVTVWYVLSSEETGIVNEPLMKIGDYADALTVTDQDVTITPAVGNDTITVDTTLPPSKLSLTGHIKALPSV